jgi:hypothetical protein
MHSSTLSPAVGFVIVVVGLVFVAAGVWIAWLVVSFLAAGRRAFCVYVGREQVKAAAALPHVPPAPAHRRA